MLFGQIEEGKLEPFKACVRIRPLLNNEKSMQNSLKNLNKNIIRLEDNKTVFIKF